MQEISFGQYALPVVLMIGLAFFYKLFDKSDGTSYIPNRLKPLIAIGLGIVLGIVAMFYNGIQPIFKNIVDFVLYGFMAGAGAVGLWEGFSAVKSGSNGAVKVAKMILIIFLLPMLLIGSLTGCAFLKPSSDVKLTEDETARLVVGGFQDASGILFDAGKVFIMAQPQYQPEWKIRIAPSFDQFNKLLAGLEVSGATGQKITPQLIMNQLQARVLDITTIYVKWGTVADEKKGKATPEQTALLIIAALQTGSILYDQLVAFSGGNISTWEVINSKNALLQNKIDAEK
jgi:hypothetical protein